MGLVVEGQSEYHAVPELLERLGERRTTPAVFQGQGSEMTPEAVVNRMIGCVRAQLSKKIRRLLVILDRENREECAPSLARRIYDALVRRLAKEGVHSPCAISVICPDRMFENWLLADPRGLSEHKYILDSCGTNAPANVDGSDGKNDLSKLFVANRKYAEGKMTGDLARNIRAECTVVQKRSRSLRKFVKEAHAE